jgi:hypothetical protein
MISAHKGMEWLKTIKTNDLAHIHEEVQKISEALHLQTDTVVSELKEAQDNNTQLLINELRSLREEFRALMLTILKN